MKNQRKTLIIDTSVLLYDKCAIHSFPGNDTVIPLVVLEELDRFKDKKGIVGENARYVNRYLDELRKNGNLHSGIKLSSGQKIKVAITGFKNVPVGLDPLSVDNQIISLAIKLDGALKNKVLLITKDINFRVKCDSLGITAEDYHKDKIIKNESEFYKGYLEVEIDDKELIDRLYEEEYESEIVDIIIEKIGRKPYKNEFVSIKCKSQSFLGCYFNNRINKISQSADLPGLKFLGIKEKNREQLFALNLLFEEEVPLVSITGLAGSGKTFLTLMAGLAGLNEGKYKRIVITRNVQPVGKDIGFLPGDINEKMLPWMSPITDNFRQGLKDKDLTYFKAMKDKGQIEIAPLSFMRGRTFSDTFFIELIVGEVTFTNTSGPVTYTYPSSTSFLAVPIVTAISYDSEGNNSANVNVFITSLTTTAVQFESSAPFTGKVHFHIYSQD